MNQLCVRLLWGGAVVLQGSFFLSGCSDDDGIDIRPKDPSAQAGTGGGGGAAGTGGSSGMGGGGAGGGGGSGGGSTDAGMDTCTPVFLDAGVVATDAGSDAGNRSDAGDAGDAGPVSNNGALSFAQDIHPIFRSLCVPCHEDEFSGGHNIAALDPAEAYSFFTDDATAYVRESLLVRLSQGSMPPDCSGPPGSSGCVSAAQFDLVRRWVAQCFPQ